MRLGEILVARGVVTVEGIEQAAEHQRTNGGRLGDNLVALGLLTQEQIDEVMHETPRSPKTIMGTGLSQANITSLVLKFLYIEQLDTISKLIDNTKLPYNIVKIIIDDLVSKKYIEVLGSSGADGAQSETRYALSTAGREMGSEAAEQNIYMGPCPVSLEQFQEQVLKQRITNEITTEEAIKECFDGLIIPDHFLAQIGPAVNSGRTLLMYGPPGNGKTSVATRSAEIFTHIVYVPYAVDIDGQIMQVYDSSIHIEAVDDESRELLAAQQPRGLRKEDFDQRWLACRRPVVVVGGELTLEMLDLSYNEDAKFYEAPMHVKALNGTFIIDDFGRQLVTPESLLNRWIVPMESRVDYFKLTTGKSFQLPFDEFLIFSTNLEPNDLMDPAFLRRIPYKIELFEPTVEDFHRIFMIIAKHSGLELPDDVFEYVVHQLSVKNSFHLAYYQPKFIIDQVLAECKYKNIPPKFTKKRINAALQNLYVHIEMDDPGPCEPAQPAAAQVEAQPPRRHQTRRPRHPKPRRPSTLRPRATTEPRSQAP